MEHELHDDELHGIRKITQNYKSNQADDLPVRVLISELEGFDKELAIHANVENNVLVPQGNATGRGCQKVDGWQSKVQLAEWPELLPLTTAPRE